MIELLILIGALLLVAGYIIAIYNGLVQGRVRVNEAWSDITVQMKRRHDLVPNLVSVVKGYASHEKDTLESVIAARSQAVAVDGSPEALAKSENFLTGALKQLFALSEAYPELRANQNFLDLQSELSEIEEHIQMSRRFYNGNVREMNTKVQSFPSNLVANAIGFQNAEFFDLDEAESAAVATAPEVKF